MESKKINIFGSDYTLAITSKNQDCRLKDVDGICDETVKELLVDSYADFEGDPTCKKNLAVQIKKSKRHEIIHAFLFESGLAENSSWAQNEEMVDFFAIQFPKLLETFKAADAL